MDHPYTPENPRRSARLAKLPRRAPSQAAVRRSPEWTRLQFGNDVDSKMKVVLHYPDGLALGDSDGSIPYTEEDDRDGNHPSEQYPPDRSNEDPESRLLRRVPGYLTGQFIRITDYQDGEEEREMCFQTSEGHCTILILDKSISLRHVPAFLTYFMLHNRCRVQKAEACAIYIILCCVHGRYDLLPPTLPIWILCFLAVVSMDWDVVQKVLPFVRTCLEPSLLDTYTPEHNIEWFTIAWAFGLECIFKDLCHRFVVHRAPPQTSEGEGSSWFHHGLSDETVSQLGPLEDQMSKLHATIVCDLSRIVAEFKDPKAWVEYELCVCSDYETIRACTIQRYEMMVSLVYELCGHDGFQAYGESRSISECVSRLLQIATRIMTIHTLDASSPQVCRASVLQEKILEQVRFDALHLTMPDEIAKHFRAQHFNNRDRYFASQFFESGMVISDFPDAGWAGEDRNEISEDSRYMADVDNDSMDEDFDPDESYWKGSTSGSEDYAMKRRERRDSIGSSEQGGYDGDEDDDINGDECTPSP